jgi:hypothetical protein
VSRCEAMLMKDGGFTEHPVITSGVKFISYNSRG